MTKKDYILIAKGLKDTKRHISIEKLKLIADDIAHYLDMDNPRFNWQKFLDNIFG